MTVTPKAWIPSFVPGSASLTLRAGHEIRIVYFLVGQMICVAVWDGSHRDALSSTFFSRRMRPGKLSVSKWR